MFIKRTFILLCCAIPTISYAFFCPGNFNQIDIGYSEAQVLQLCGKPAQVEMKEVKAPGIQEWNYYVQQTVTSFSNYQTIGTLKIQITFDPSGKVININANGIGVGATAICGPIIQLGYTTDQVQAACGKPAAINQPTSTTEAPSSEVTTYTYDSDPPVVLTFEKGILTQRQ